MLIELKPITLKDKAWMDKILLAENTQSSDFNFGNIYVWDKLYQQRISQCGNRLLINLHINGKNAFSFPVGTGDLTQSIDSLSAFARANGEPLRIFGISEKNRLLLESLYPGRFEFTADVKCFDCIYKSERLATYSGKALQAKKNHCNHFEAEHQWHFTPLTRELIPLCTQMLSSWFQDNRFRLEQSAVFEHEAILRAFSAYEALSLEGGVLWAEDTVVGFTLGEFTNSNTFDIHFEKARADIQGAYPMVCREFVRMLMRKHSSLLYINREDDMGIEGLRRSKRSYKPEYLVEKYIAVERETFPPFLSKTVFHLIPNPTYTPMETIRSS